MLATSALDSTSERVVQEALDNLLKMKKRTTIIIAHRLSTIRDADKIIVLKDGVVVEQGSHEELLSVEESLYGALVKLQMSSLGSSASLQNLAEADQVTSAQLSQALAVANKADAEDVTTAVSVSGAAVNDVEVGGFEAKSGPVATSEEDASKAEVALTTTDTHKKTTELANANTPTVKAEILATELEVQEKTSSVAWIWALSAPERPYLYVGLIGAALVGVAFPLLGYFLAEMIKIFFNPSSADMRQQSTFWAYMFLVVAASQFLGAFSAQYCFGVITERLARRVREKSFYKMLQMEVQWYDQPSNTAGALAQQLATDCMMIKALTGERASTSVSQIVTMIVAFIIAFYYCWEMTLLMFGLFPVIGAAFGVQHTLVMRAAGSAMEATNEAGSVASQTLLNIRTVNAFGLEKMSIAEFEKRLVGPLAQFVRKGLVTGFGMGFGQFVILSSAGLAYYVGGQLVLLGRTTFPDIMAVVLSIMFGSVGLGQFAADASDKTEAMLAAKKIQILWEKETKINALVDEGVIPDAVQGHIELHDVSFAYPMRPEHNVYNHINLTVEAGTTVALVGPSGCGKSTAVSLIERFYDPAEGAVLLDGVDIRTLRLSWLRQQIGLVSQEPVLFTGSIYENIAQGKDGATTEEIEAAAKMANAHDFISAFPEGYNTQVGERGVQLSGGQKQRCAIARAIVRDPKILILDEGKNPCDQAFIAWAHEYVCVFIYMYICIAYSSLHLSYDITVRTPVLYSTYILATSALDSTSERVVQEALDNLLKMKKRTTIIIAHRLSTIRDADKIVVLSDGVVVEEGNHETLLQASTGHYLRLMKNSQHSTE
jgi:ATP-binding cassette, subfamily B (MDR/TAP), member 1